MTQIKRNHADIFNFEPEHRAIFDACYSILKSNSEQGLAGINERPQVLSKCLAVLAEGVVNRVGSGGVKFQEWWDTFDGIAKHLGFAFLGAGHFSAAFKHSMLPGRVFKVGFKKEDSGAAYTAFCRMHQGNPHIPNVYHVERYPACYIVVLDELVKLKSADCDGAAFRIIEDYVQWSERNAEARFAEWSRFSLREPKALLECNSELVSISKKIHEFFSGIASFDIHDENVMKHPVTGELVITDPVSFSSDDVMLSDNEMMDPESLIAEVERLANYRMIDRCRNRKGKRDPEGTFQRERKQLRKWKRQREVQDRKWRREREARMAAEREACKPVFSTCKVGSLLQQMRDKVGDSIKPYFQPEKW